MCVNFVGADDPVRPSTHDSGSVDAAGRCGHRPLQPLIDALHRTCRGGHPKGCGAVDAAGHMGPALQHYRRASVEFVGATPCGRPSTYGSGSIDAAGRCGHRPLQPLIDAFPRTCRGGHPKGCGAVDAAGHMGPALQHYRRASVEFVGATPCGRPSTYESASVDAAG